MALKVAYIFISKTASNYTSCRLKPVNTICQKHILSFLLVRSHYSLFTHKQMPQNTNFPFLYFFFSPIFKWGQSVFNSHQSTITKKKIFKKYGQMLATEIFVNGLCKIHFRQTNKNGSRTRWYLQTSISKILLKFYKLQSVFS